MTRFDQLANLLSRTRLTWASESDFPIEPVTVPFWRVWGWKATGEKPSDVIRRQWEGASFNAPYSNLFATMCAWDTWNEYRVYKRPTGCPGEFELYLLVRDGFGFVGVKTRVVET